MNGRRARKLRKFAKRLTPNLPDKKLMINRKTGVNLHLECTRQVYQMLKKQKNLPVEHIEDMSTKTI